MTRRSMVPGPPPRLAAMALVACLSAACGATRGGTGAESGTSRIEHFNEGVSLPAGLPFSEAVRVDSTLYMSGQIGIRPGTLELVPGGLEAEARQTMENIRATLEAYGYSMRDVVKCLVMIEDISRWADFNAVYVEYFEAPYPARSALGTDGLALGAAVEVECIAVK